MLRREPNQSGGSQFPQASFLTLPSVSGLSVFEGPWDAGSDGFSCMRLTTLKRVSTARPP